MATPSSHLITQLLADWRSGDRAALDRLLPLVYEELHRLAHHYVRQERADHTLQTTAVVNEAYLRLADCRSMQWQDRTHFFAVAARLMRRILVDHARTKRREKRGGNAIKITLDERAAVAPPFSLELLALDEALTKLEAEEPRKSRVVELRCFGGLNNQEIAEVLDIEPNTVIRDWNFAKAWLRRELGRTP